MTIYYVNRLTIAGCIFQVLYTLPTPNSVYSAAKLFPWNDKILLRYMTIRECVLFLSFLHLKYLV